MSINIREGSLQHPWSKPDTHSPRWEWINACSSLLFPPPACRGRIYNAMIKNEWEKFTHSGGVPRKLKCVKITSTRCFAPAMNVRMHCLECPPGLWRRGAVNVPFWGPPVRLTNVWSHSKNRKTCFFLEQHRLHSKANSTNANMLACKQGERVFSTNLRHSAHPRTSFCFCNLPIKCEAGASGNKQ